MTTFRRVCGLQMNAKEMVNAFFKPILSKIELSRNTRDSTPVGERDHKWHRAEAGAVLVTAGVGLAYQASMRSKLECLGNPTRMYDHLADNVLPVAGALLASGTCV